MVLCDIYACFEDSLAYFNTLLVVFILYYSWNLKQSTITKGNYLKILKVLIKVDKDKGGGGSLRAYNKNPNDNMFILLKWIKGGGGNCYQKKWIKCRVFVSPALQIIYIFCHCLESHPTTDFVGM